MKFLVKYDPKVGFKKVNMLLLPSKSVNNWTRILLFDKEADLPPISNIHKPYHFIFTTKYALSVLFVNFIEAKTKLKCQKSLTRISL